MKGNKSQAVDIDETVNDGQSTCIEGISIKLCVSPILAGAIAGLKTREQTIKCSIAQQAL